ncbi:DUF4136 domain-containing protein [Salinimicrobium sp. HB62]|uniref:DUF4136 domain-containing protein n=1 Tax=Salinimicrobium sp. HB62 TaxID=3077781 RepID=UPI002D785D6C|nr:DUF4136 domain-containing protein [Salinimicrobium sp. HB62]
MKFLQLFCFCLLLSACGGPRAAYDYDEQANFSSYSSIAIYPGINTGLSELDEKRLLASVVDVLRERDLFVSVVPDLYLNINSEEYQEPNRTNVGVGIGGTGRNVGVGVSGGIPLGGPETFLRLTFDLVDAKTDNLVWQAVVDSKFDPNSSPEERHKRFEKVVRKALEGYPPKR